MTMHGRRMRPRRRPVLVAVLAAALAVAAIAGAVMVSAQRSPGTASSTTAPSAEAGGGAYRPSFHLTPGAHWMNDPQRPFLLGGVWHFYYLYNKDYPTGNGTEWRHLTSPDLVHWTDRGTAIPKFANGLGDIETGSAVVDRDGTAGHGRNAVIAIVTQQADGVQRQSQFYSTDGGYHFASDPANPVMPNPGAKDWRDPKVDWDPVARRWTLVLAEGHKLGFYTSPDLRSWTYRSGMEADGIGTVECPDLFRLDLDGDPGRPIWVLAASAHRPGGTTGFAYWTGRFDGAGFVPDRQDPLWLDAGPDFYAAVTWAQPGSTSTRYAMAWMNNWAYARSLPTTAFQGADTVPRELRLSTVDGVPQLVSTPVAAAAEGTAPARDEASVEVRARGVESRELPAGGAVVQIEVRPAHGPLTLRLSGAAGSHVDLRYDPGAQELTLDRGHDGYASTARAGDVYRSAATVRVRPVDDAVRLTLLVDRSSAEVFGGDGSSLTALTFLPGGARSITVSNRMSSPVRVSVAPAPGFSLRQAPPR